jgi:hypothetical protein
VAAHPEERDAKDKTAAAPTQNDAAGVLAAGTARDLPAIGKPADDSAEKMRRGESRWRVIPLSGVGPGMGVRGGGLEGAKEEGKSAEGFFGPKRGDGPRFLECGTWRTHLDANPRAKADPSLGSG